MKGQRALGKKHAGSALSGKWAQYNRWHHGICASTSDWIDVLQQII
jgi:hypothetical protein